ncbi:MAG: metallopeptidase family protein [Nitrospira sp.]|nr:metallopeptidase family protein [Nitrospira sp.]MDH4242242.1 metallopeptidase family protein [Nitrospira sp.]MDH4354637.1 metallopeptidase family protein [Nitrospira sp.]MDH5317664.1 metallopeptidase family protein [Nitrospira sp.]
MARREPISSETFAALVQQAVADLPTPYAKLMESIAVVVEEEPPEDVLRDLGLDEKDDLLGLYQGQSLADDSFFRPGGEPPPRISIYRGPILRICESPEEVVQEVYDTVVHELGHHVGLDDDEMPY